MREMYTFCGCMYRVQNSRRLLVTGGCWQQSALCSHLPVIFHGSNRKLHLLIGEINATGICLSKYFISEEVMQRWNMNAQCGLDLFFNVLLARSRLRDGGERRQSGRAKKKNDNWWNWEGEPAAHASLAFFTPFPNFAIHRMISNSEPNVLLGLEL